MNDAYQELGNLLVAQCPPAFIQAELKAELDEGFARIVIECTMRDGSKTHPSIRPGDTTAMTIILDGIREDAARSTGDKVDTCQFTVDSAGRFNINFGYADRPD